MAGLLIILFWAAIGHAANDATVTLRAFPEPVLPGVNTTITWETMNASSCTASGDWSGTKVATGGSETQGITGSSDTFTISCNGPSGRAFVDTITVNQMTGSEFYIATTGCSDTDPGSISQPWCSIDKANATLTAGQIVWLRGGTYQDQIRPANSGTSGNYIAYAEFPGESVTISTEFSGDSYCVNLADRDYVIIDGFLIDDCSNNHIRMVRSNNNIIRRNDIRGNYTGVDDSHPMNSASFNKVQYNTYDSDHVSPSCAAPFLDNCEAIFDHIAMIDDAGGEETHHNLIENNDFGRSSHVSMGANISSAPLNHSNVMRLNQLHNVWHSSSSLFPTNGDLYERNVIFDTKTEAASNPYTPHLGSGGVGIQVGAGSGRPLSSDNNILRFNIFDNNKRFLFLSSLDNKVYQNTFVAQYDLMRFSDGTGNGHDNIFWNNIVDNDVLFAFCCNVDGGFNDNRNNNIRDDFDDAGTTRTLPQMVATYPTKWIGNVNVDPQFTNVPSRDYSLQETSPMVDAALFLTTTTSTGSGTALPVADAGFFIDGWGIVKGDIVQTEIGEAARIVSIAGNTLTLDRSITWTSGDGVSLPYSGNGPDIGAIEFLQAIGGSALTFLSDGVIDSISGVSGLSFISDGNIDSISGLGALPLIGDGNIDSVSGLTSLGFITDGQVDAVSVVD